MLHSLPARRLLTPLLLLPFFSCADDPEPAPVEELPRLHAYLLAAPYTELQLEIDYVPVAAPSSTVEAEVEAWLATVVDKPDGVHMVRDQALETRGADYAWTLAQLAQLARDTDDPEPEPPAIAMHLLFVDGYYADDPATFALQWEQKQLVVFRQVLKDACEGGVNANLPVEQRNDICRLAERDAWAHQLGHLIGLVDNGIPMSTPHADGAGAHDIAEDCLMHAQIHGLGAVDAARGRVLIGQLEGLQLDEACMADVDQITGNVELESGLVAP